MINTWVVGTDSWTKLATRSSIMTLNGNLVFIDVRRWHLGGWKVNILEDIKARLIELCALATMETIVGIQQEYK